MNMRRGQKAAFTLLEVLVAGGVLFIVTAAVVGLSNSIIQGTAVNADQTITDRWAAEGIELTTKVRNDTILKVNKVNEQQEWFTPAIKAENYGWYRLKLEGTNWKLEKIPTFSNIARFAEDVVTDSSPAERLSNQGLVGYRLICVELVGAVAFNSDSTVNCNTDNSGQPMTSDGDRTLVNACHGGDEYCANTRPSLNRNKINSLSVPLTVIPAGNAVKIRSVVVWQDREAYRVSDIASMLTNWKGYEQF